MRPKKLPFTGKRFTSVSRQRTSRKTARISQSRLFLAVISNTSLTIFPPVRSLDRERTGVNLLPWLAPSKAENLIVGQTVFFGIITPAKVDRSYHGEVAEWLKALPC